MRVALEHAECLMAGDGGDFHQPQAVLEKPCGRFCARQIMESQVVQEILVGFTGLLGAIFENTAPCLSGRLRQKPCAAGRRESGRHG